MYVGMKVHRAHDAHSSVRFLLDPVRCAYMCAHEIVLFFGHNVCHMNLVRPLSEASSYTCSKSYLVACKYPQSKCKYPESKCKYPNFISCAREATYVIQFQTVKRTNELNEKSRYAVRFLPCVPHTLRILYFHCLSGGIPDIQFLSSILKFVQYYA